MTLIIFLLVSEKLNCFFGNWIDIFLVLAMTFIVFEMFYSSFLSIKYNIRAFYQNDLLFNL